MEGRRGEENRNVEEGSTEEKSIGGFVYVCERQNL